VNDLVAILMSTYNGYGFVEQQLNSLYLQTHSNIKIFIRDDGSVDDTQKILRQEYARGSINLFEEGNNLGVTGSFFELLNFVINTDCQYVAFSDQDDVWLKNKVEQAILKLSNFSDCPALYCSSLEFVDENLNSLGFSNTPRKIGFGNALFENIAVGCSIVLNRKAIDLLCQQRLPNEVYVHDWWCYLVLSCFGKVIFDDQALIKYRQHSGNVIGASTNSLGIFKRKISRILNGRLWISEQAKVFYDLFDEKLSPDDRELVELLLKAKSSFWHRLLLATSKDIWRQKFLDNLILRIVILMNRF
jgi:glycosyltransferase involved in cell wall biosynthesis